MYISIPDCFMIAFIVGLLFGLVYEALRIVRLILRFKAAIFLCDILFFVLSAVAVMTLSKSLGSYVRIYTVLGFGAGVFCYIVTIGRLLNLAESAASIAWRKTIGRLIHIICNGIKKLIGGFQQKTVLAFSKCSKDLQNRKENFSKHLKSKSNLLYNNKEPNKIKRGGEAHVIQAKIKRSS